MLSLLIKLKQAKHWKMLDSMLCAMYYVHTYLLDYSQTAFFYMPPTPWHFQKGASPPMGGWIIEEGEERAGNQKHTFSHISPYHGKQTANLRPGEYPAKPQAHPPL